MFEVFEISPFRKEQIRLQIVRAIKKEPTTINLKRDKVTIDKYKSKKRVAEDITTIEVFLDYKKAYRKDLNESVPDGNVVEVKTIDLIAVYEPSYELKFGDYFIIDGMKHVIKYAKNHNDIYWQGQVTVEVNPAKIEGE